MTLGTPNTLPNFKCKNITIKNNVSEKLLGVIIDNIDIIIIIDTIVITEHLNTV